MDGLYDRLIQIAGEDAVFRNEPMSKHTSFRIGGPAEYYIAPKTEECLKALEEYCAGQEVPCCVIGNGTNLLAADEGIRGVVISTCEGLSDVCFAEAAVTAQAGILLSKLAAEAAKRSLTGLEFAAGIPGSLGGGVTMNAGAYGGEMKDILVSADVYVPGEGIRTFTAEELKLGYRTSIIKEKGYTVLSAVLQLKNGDEDAIRAKMAELKEARVSKQPLEYPSAGSAFKRPEGYFAGKLISDAGLKGFSVGGAQVSEKHAGFIINTGGATAKDVKALINHIIQTVQEKFGVTLEPEIRFIG